MCAAEKDHYERGFALEDVPFEEEFEQTNDRVWRKHEIQQQKSEEMGQFVGECADRCVHVPASSNDQPGDLLLVANQ